MIRLLTAVLLPALAATSVAAEQSLAPDARDERARVIAALERLMMTGHPLHINHGEGVWLQAAVERAFVTNDHEIERMAQRASKPLIARIDMPVTSIRDARPIELRLLDVLRLPRPVALSAQIFASIDGGEIFPMGNAPTKGGSGVSLPLPSHALTAGVHHVRLQARITYTGAGRIPPPETRNLPDLTYALYDPSRSAPFDARVFVESPGTVRASRFSDGLPDEPFSVWLLGVLSRAAATPPAVDWLGRYCDDRIREYGPLPRAGDICAVGYFMVRGIIGQIWMRTGRVEVTDTEMKWLAEQPSFQGMRLLSGHMTEFRDLAELPMLLDTDPGSWPRPDVSVAPGDISVSRVGSQLMISAIIRNNGLADVLGVEVFIAASVHGERGESESVIVDVPRRGQVEIRRRLPFSASYGTVVVHAMQASEHAPFESFHPDPTPDDAVAFRIVNPTKAPAGYAARIVKDCGGICRGY